MMTTSWEWETAPHGDPELVRVMFLPISQYVPISRHFITLLAKSANEADWAMRYPDPKKRKVAQLTERFKAAGYTVKDNVATNAE